MKRKVLSVLFATVLTAGMLSGCGSSGNTSEKTSDQKEESLEEETTQGQTAVDEETAAKAVSEEEAEKAGFTDQEESTAEEESSSDSTLEEDSTLTESEADSTEERFSDGSEDAKKAGTAVIDTSQQLTGTYHAAIDGFMIQGGDPKGDGTGGADETIKGEFSNNGVKNDISHVRGTISMARSSAPDSASSQFFIVQSDSTYLDGDYAAFGHVTSGMDVVDQICKDVTPTDGNGSIAKDQR